ncbi:hypothetical protein B0A48_08378 [Cryoendolithus antarcticus]|uniref:Uncharacterized protein n=1 Tax=Cryoendolithus antarcticus TaxID=1507870 RepID=A0A1V8T599_9PEZI|nr:hypothetical protein B0A48_08378 [Cryoendolithus antarcticus]
MSTPSEFLTFMRRASTQASRARLTTKPSPITGRPFSLSTARSNTFEVGETATGKVPDKKHATDKKDKLDVQSDSSAKGRDAHANNDGGSATKASDERNSAQKTKLEFPESPDQIGMQDERGGKGHS